MLLLLFRRLSIYTSGVRGWSACLEHLPVLIYDLAIILTAAAVSTLLFSKMKQPIVLGYLIAGFLVGPHFNLTPTIVDTESVKVWAEIGVIFLLFGLGLEFSFKKLAKVGKSASIAAFFEIVIMIGCGYLFGRAVGWSQMDSLFLGAILSMSSTTIIIRAFDEAGLKGRGFVSLVFGILIVQDLAAILLMVLLAAISIPDNFSGANLLYLSARLGFFLLLWFVAGIYLIPTLLRWVRSFVTSEIMLVVSIGLCLTMVVVASKAGFSAALGAFIMGSILAETEDGSRIEHLMISVKDLFAAVFFVSVGMLIDPTVLKEHWLVVLLIVIMSIFGKLFGSVVGALLSGRSLKQSMQAGMSLAQIGEFSFIIATLGMTLNVTSQFLYPIIIAVSAVTTFTTPYMIRYSGPIYAWTEARIPAKLLDYLNRYEVAMSTDNREGALGLVWRIYGFTILLNTVVVVAITLATKEFILPKLYLFDDQFVARMVAGLATLVLCSPFLWAIVLMLPRKLASEDASTLQRLRSLQIGVFFVRLIAGLSLLAFIVNTFSTAQSFSLLVMTLFIASMFLLKRFIAPFYLSVEKRFISNLNSNEGTTEGDERRKSELAPWDASLADFVLSSDSPLAGKTLEESNFRGSTGATVAMIDRGHSRLFAPGRAERLLPNDRIFLIGTDDQIAVAKSMIEAEGIRPPQVKNDMFGLQSVKLNEGSSYINMPIRDTGIRENALGLIVGIEREGERILNPDSDFVLRPGDLIWVVGQRDKVQKLRK